MNYENILMALGIRERKRDIPLSKIMVSLKTVLQDLKKQSNYGTIDNPIPIIVIDDHLANYSEFQLMSGNLLQFVEEQLATCVHISSNNSTLRELKKLSGHSRLKKISLSYVNQKELEQYPFFDNTDVKKLGGKD